MSRSPQKYPIDTRWFRARLDEKGLSVRGLARYLEIDGSAASRMLNGERQMQVEEEAGIAKFLGIPVQEVVQHRGAANLGFAEMAQAPLDQATHVAPSISQESGKRPLPPIFGSMKGTTIVMPGVDLTEPADADWGKVYED